MADDEDYVPEHGPEDFGGEDFPAPNYDADWLADAMAAGVPLPEEESPPAAPMLFDDAPEAPKPMEPLVLSSRFGQRAPPLDGLLHNVPFVDYAKWAAVNASLLKECRRSMAHGRAYLAARRRTPTRPMRVGAALHVWCLERERYSDAIEIVDGFTGDKRNDPDIIESMARRGVTPINPWDDDAVKTMSRAIAAHPYARKLVTSPGQCETVITWIDEATGLPCKSRADKWWTLDDQAKDLAIDIKSAMDISPAKIGRVIDDYGYHIQAAFYRRAIRTVTKRDCQFLFVFVENTPPNCVRVVELNEATMTEGDRVVDSLLRRLREAIDLDEWRGYSDDVEEVSIPPYAFSKGNMR